MTAPEFTQPQASTQTLSGELTGGHVWLIGTTLFSLLAIYFVGIDQGAVSLFGNDTHVHEFMHDARHLLSFACH